MSKELKKLMTDLAAGRITQNAVDKITNTQEKQKKDIANQESGVTEINPIAEKQTQERPTKSKGRLK